jgi:hypothetical protein
MVFLQSKMKLDKMQECSHRCISDADDAKQVAVRRKAWEWWAGLEIKF